MLVSQATLLQQQSGNHAPRKMDLKLDSNVLAGGGLQWISLERKKGLTALTSMTYRLQWTSIDHNLERETGFPVDPYPIDSTEVFGTPLCLTDWIMYYPCCLGKRFLTTPLQVLVFWSYRLFILPDHCLHAPGQQQPCGD